jgi:hypothetical protein
MIDDVEIMLFVVSFIISFQFQLRHITVAELLHRGSLQLNFTRQFIGIFLQEWIVLENITSYITFSPF